jgi:hypothetical protein
MGDRLDRGTQRGYETKTLVWSELRNFEEEEDDDDYDLLLLG